MQKGLTKKLDYEKGKLRSKAAQSDYRDRFTEEGDKFDRGGSHGNNITLADAAKVGPAIQKIWRDEKSRAVRFYTCQMRASVLKIGQWIFKFNFTPAEFARENNLPSPDAAKLLPKIRAEAEERLRMTLGRANKAQLKGCHHEDIESGKTWVVWQLCFRTFIPTAQPVEWGNIYKRILLCPMEQEPSE